MLLRAPYLRKSNNWSCVGLIILQSIFLLLLLQFSLENLLENAMMYIVNILLNMLSQNEILPYFPSSIAFTSPCCMQEMDALHEIWDDSECVTKIVAMNWMQEDKVF